MCNVQLYGMPFGAAYRLTAIRLCVRVYLRYAAHIYGASRHKKGCRMGATHRQPQPCRMRAAQRPATKKSNFLCASFGLADF